MSGGQLGVDQQALRAARACSLQTGGWAPLGWRTSEGPAPWLGTHYNLKEHSSPDYPPRTYANVRDSDGTLIFGWPHSPGCKITRNYCVALQKPCCIVQWMSPPVVFHWTEERDRALRFLRIYNIRVLNVAGNRERRNPGVSMAAYDFLTEVFSWSVSNLQPG